MQVRVCCTHLMVHFVWVLLSTMTAEMITCEHQQSPAAFLQLDGWKSSAGEAASTGDKAPALRVRRTLTSC